MLPGMLEWGGMRFFKKDEFHVTLCAIFDPKEPESFASLTHLSKDEAEERVLGFFSSFITEKPIRFRFYHNDFRFVNRMGRKTFVVRCDMEHFGEFFAELNKKFECGMPTQPAHVTLYTTNEERLGIHIPSTSVMEGLEKVELPELHKAFKTL